jgi:hypothetical protein
MNTIERLKERIEEHQRDEHAIAHDNAEVDVDILVAARDRQAIMQALVELLEKVDRPIAFDLPIHHPDILQHIVATPVTLEKKP